jgi:hypothetical protein
MISPRDLAQDLTWNELLHTSYFEAARFCKLLAYTISRLEGFRATGLFKADPDYLVAARWYDEMRSKENAAEVLDPPSSSLSPRACRVCASHRS